MTSFNEKNVIILIGDSISMAKSMDSFVSIANDDMDSFREKSPTDSPRKDRLRDKIASKFRLRSSRTVNISDQSLNDSTKSTEDDELARQKVFGCNLDLVEKDGYYKDIPKFVVECIKYVEFESNLRTAGLYRISGNKTIMDALKKKFNEKKSPKKESKYLCLQEQDVHTLTGLLKMFFRELESSLMSKEVFANCTSGKNQLKCSQNFKANPFMLLLFVEKITANEMREKLEEMPKTNYALLKYLFKHFKSIERYEKENLMNSGE
jgi:Rho GTPase-activating protein 15